MAPRSNTLEPKRTIPDTVKFLKAMPPSMVVPKSVNVSPVLTLNLPAKSLVINASPGTEGTRPSSIEFRRLNLSISDVPGEKRSIPHPTTGPCARVSPRLSGKSISPPKRMRRTQSSSGYDFFNVPVKVSALSIARSLGIWVSSLA